jgi:hypothetical protein
MPFLFCAKEKDEPFPAKDVPLFTIVIFINSSDL